MIGISSVKLVKNLLDCKDYPGIKTES